MAEQALDGFDHTQHSEEVARRWGTTAAAKADGWWNGHTPGERADWMAAAAALNASWIAAVEAGESPGGARAQAIARQHVAWLASVPGTPAAEGGDLRGYVLGLSEMYVADERFAANYGGADGAAFVRDALRAHIADLFG